MRLEGGADAVRFEGEHREGIAITAILPYSRGRLRKKVTFGQMSAMEGERHVWPSRA